tara:strand:- start:3306 stop:3536 length:231 start_codon:yes stop_codon:yes gene_type:complete
MTNTRKRHRTVETKFSIGAEDAEDIQSLARLAIHNDNPHEVLKASLETGGFTSRRHVAYARGLLDAALMPIEGGNQ